MSAGDITLTASINKVVVSGFSVSRLNVDLENSSMQIVFKETNGTPHEVVLRDTDCIGFGITGSTVNEGLPRAITGEYTKLIGIIFGAATGNANARRTAATQALVTDGVITVTGTVA